VCHSYSIDRRCVEIACSLAHEPLTRGALLDEEELLLGVVEEEEDVNCLRSCRLCWARGHVPDRFIPCVLHHVLDKSSAIVRKARRGRAQILVDPPRGSDGAVERIAIWGAVGDALRKDAVVVCREEGADGWNNRADSRFRGSDRLENSLVGGGRAAENSRCGRNCRPFCRVDYFLVNGGRLFCVGGTRQPHPEGIIGCFVLIFKDSSGVFFCVFFFLSIAYGQQSPIRQCQRHKAQGREGEAEQSQSQP